METEGPTLTLSTGAVRSVTRPTMREVAALAGVSLKTVSRVVNRETGVSPELAERVRSAVDRLAYRHNAAASNLRRGDGKTATLGVLFEDLANPFASAVHRAIEDVARARGVLVLAGSSDEDPSRERDLVTAFVSRRVDGVILLSGDVDHSYLLNERRAGTAIVFIDRPPAFLDADTVTVDNEGGSALAVRHLIAHGHRRIAYVGDRLSVHTASARHAGYERALRESGLTVDDRLVLHDRRSIDDADAGIAALLATDHAPTAIFASQNLVTIGVLRALHRLRLHPTVALVGFDDFALAEALEPGVTVIAQDTNRIGREAAEQIVRRLDGDVGPSRFTTIPVTLIARGSGELPGPGSPPGPG